MAVDFVGHSGGSLPLLPSLGSQMMSVFDFLLRSAMGRGKDGTRKRRQSPSFLGYLKRLASGIYSICNGVLLLVQPQS